MRRLVLLCAVLFAGIGSAGRGQGVLPASFGEWTSSGSGSTPASMPDAQLMAFQEYGLSSGEAQSYQGPDRTIGVSAYVFGDPSGAYGAYTYLIVPDLKRADFTEHSSISSDRALILVGNLLIDVSAKGLAAHTADLRALVAAISPRAQSAPLPTLWQYLPEKQMIARSDHYVLGPRTLDQLFPGHLGNSLGFSKGAEAELAHYKLASHDATLLIADFPTPQLAAQQLRNLQKQYNVNGSQPGSASPELFAKRSLTLVAIVSGAPTETDARALLDQVHSGAQLTWDEPTFQFKEPSIEMMVVGAILGTGIICGFALVAGLAFGGFRLFIKRMLPGKVFDRGTQLQVLQLGLSSKPINAEDFYAAPGLTTGGTAVDKNLPDRIALRIFR